MATGAGAARGREDAIKFAANPRLGAQVTSSPQMVAVLTMLAFMVEREARKRAPVDTGRLRNSISHRIRPVGTTRLVAEIGTNVEYAAAQEFGTKHMRGKRYLGTALAIVSQQMAARGRR